MQYLKEDIREKIIDAALNEFVTKDYSGASMRAIADKSDVTAGNIYRYFKSKEDLLESCLRPLFNELNVMIHQDYSMGYSDEQNIPVREIIGKNIIKIYHKYPREFYILRNGLKRTLYDAYYDNLVKQVVEKIKLVLSSQDLDAHPMILDVVARNQINAVIHILENADENEAEEIISQFFTISYKILDFEGK